MRSAPDAETGGATGEESTTRESDEYRFAGNLPGDEGTVAERGYDDHVSAEHDAEGHLPDVLLDVPVVKVEEINLEVEDLRAHISLKAEVLDLLKLNVGADVALGRVALDIKGVEAQALLKVRLDNVAAILDRVLTTIDRNPQILENITQGVRSVVEELGEGAGLAVEEVGAGAGSAVADVGGGAGSAVESTGQAVEGVGAGAGSAVEDLGEGGSETVERVGPGAGKAVEGVGEAAQETGRGAANTAGSAGQAVQEAGVGATERGTTYTKRSDRTQGKSKQTGRRSSSSGGQRSSKKSRG